MTLSLCFCFFSSSPPLPFCSCLSITHMSIYTETIIHINEKDTSTLRNEKKWWLLLLLRHCLFWPIPEGPCNRPPPPTNVVFIFLKPSHQIKPPPLCPPFRISRGHTTTGRQATRQTMTSSEDLLGVFLAMLTSNTSLTLTQTHTLQEIAFGFTQGQAKRRCGQRRALRWFPIPSSSKARHEATLVQGLTNGMTAGYGWVEHVRVYGPLCFAFRLCLFFSSSSSSSSSSAFARWLPMRCREWWPWG